MKLHSSIRLPAILIGIIFLSVDIQASSGDAAQDETRQIMDQAYETYHRYQDVVGAMRLYRQLAERGYAPAQVRLGYILDLGEEDEEALKWYKKAAEQDEPEALFYVAQHLLLEQEVEYSEEARALWQRSAEGGHIPAMMALGNYYSSVKDGAKAAAYWIEAASKGDQVACVRLAEAYDERLPGFVAESDKSPEWWDFEACKNLTR